MERSDAQVLALSGNILGGKHSSIRRRLITISLDLHAAGDADKGLTTGEVRDVYEGVIEGGEKMRNGEDFFALNEVDTAAGVATAAASSLFGKKNDEVRDGIKAKLGRM
eukprot:CAMPEP_0201664492 /NCGR_PEP_ID=MMETSP0494-20130426/5944_1 /ASSEMBLY_ACC=CAM_ASM_000839 /TAXON_ID=420259 /ORGANISM="Thalassiosira gravida, Strain GMp14c1" /LENGTH=108 /DNA_ID=CAMNT_0048143269 /DNA_START=241 /DNA_END=568 /DNA_ORIENTATION=-